MNGFIIVAILAVAFVLWYAVQDAIGKRQAMDRKEWLRERGFEETEDGTVRPIKKEEPQVRKPTDKVAEIWEERQAQMQAIEDLEKE